MGSSSAPIQAQSGYDSPLSSYFILQNLPQGAEFGLDTQLWTVAKFSVSKPHPQPCPPSARLPNARAPTRPAQLARRSPFATVNKLTRIWATWQGVKFIPPGLHLFVFAASPRTNSARTEAVGAAGSLGVRHGLLRVFSPGETIVETYSELEEGLESDALRRRRRTVPAASSAVETVSSTDYLKSLDSSLAAYPSDLVQSWPPLVNLITTCTIARVVGLDSQGSGRVDALMSSVADDDEIAQGKDGEQRRQWGKERAETELNQGPKIIELEEGEDEQADGGTEDKDELLAFVAVDLKRSWPPGAQGEDLSRWSQDKSWLLSKTIAELGAGKPEPYLFEFR